MKRFISIFLLISLCSLCLSQPIITAFTPVSGPAGNVVTITGANFSSVPSGNTVFFGGKAATVLSASATSLQVQVPVGAPYQPISVTTDGLTGYSQNSFTLTYSGGVDLSTATFSTATLVTTGLRPNGIVAADFNGDGKSDLATPNNFSTTGSPGSISIIKNTSSAGSLSFDPKQDIANGPQTYALASGDINGDGKPDLVACSIADQNISIFRNTSSGSNISFASPVMFASGTSPQSIAIGDIDGDGKPDVIVVNATANSISVFRNTTAGNIISLAPKTDFNTQLFPKAVAVADFDGDGKTDIAVTNNLSYSFTIFRNTSSPGNITLSATNIVIATGFKPAGITIFDYDLDNKPDIGIEVNEIDNSQRANCQIYKNTSTFGTITFVYRTVLSGSSNYVGYNISAGDINGDGKVDIALPVTGENVARIFQNILITGQIFPSFSQPVGSFYALAPYASTLADLDGDNRPELVTTNFIGSNLSVFPNRCGFPVINSFSPSSGTPNTTVTIYGQSFINITSVTFGGIPAASFNVVSPTQITAVVGNGASGNVAITNNLGTAGLGGFVYSGPPFITSFSPQNAGAGQIITINGSFTGTVTGVSFGSVPASSFTVVSPTQITAVVATGASGSVAVTTNQGSASLPGFTFFVPPTISSFSPNTGFTGTPVTITGSNFAGATGVKIGNVPVSSYTVISPTAILATAGHGVSGSVSVITPGGIASKDTFFFDPPSIGSITPESGPVGIVVTVNGTNFSDVPQNNIVHFGAVKASVISASNNALSVIVPAGATYDKVTVTANGFTAYSGQFFRSVFAGTDPALSLNPASFKWHSKYIAGNDPYFMKCADIDGDGKVDQVVSSYSTDGKVMVFRNTSVNGTISFASPVDVTQSYYNTMWSIVTADFNGDGKTDVLLRAQQTVLWLFINSSSPGNISFLPYINLPLPTPGFSEFLAGDFDKDAKTDIAIRAYASGSGSGNVHLLSIYRNIGINGNVAFSRTDKTINGTIVQDYLNGEFVDCPMLPGDFDQDGKTDFIVRSAALGSLSVIRNLSTPGNIVFNNPITVSVPGTDLLSVPDMNNDGKPDLAGRSRINNRRLVLLRNTSSGAGNFGFVPQDSASTQADVTFAITGELTGDAKPDILVRNGTNTVAVFRNTSNPAGNISIDTINSYTDITDPTTMNTREAFIADMDGDGKNDVNLVDRNRLSVFRNQINESANVQLCPSVANTSIVSGLSGTVYQWKLNTGNGFNNITNNANYTGTNSNTLTLSNIPSSWRGYQYLCVANNSSSTIYSLKVSNTWTGTVSNVWENPANWSCNAVPDNFTDVNISSGTIVLNSNTTIRSLKLSGGANLAISSGLVLTILY